MCGITGEFGKIPDSNWLFESLYSTRYRGPDNLGIREINSQLRMGVNRLAMTDPHPRSNQPMTFSQDSAISFNGEIYNFEELRRDLTARGCEFRTLSDTEVLLNGLTKDGVDFLKKVNGMYAFAYFNKTKNSVILGRDSLGKKPLFYSAKTDLLRWSSTPDSLREDTKISQEALIDYFAVGYILGPKQIQSTVMSVNPGEVIEFKFNQAGKLDGSSSSYQDLLAREKVGTLREELLSAVNRRVLGHDKVAISMSGGFDSTVIAIICKELGVNAIGYSANWSDSDKQRYNEDHDYAAAIMHRLGLEFKSVQMPSQYDLVGYLDKFSRSSPSPNNNPTGVSMIKLYETINLDSIKLALTGDGADEILGGYQRYHQIEKIPNILRLKGLEMSDFLMKKNHSKFKRSRFLAHSQLSHLDPFSWWRWHMLFGTLEISELISGISDSDVKTYLRQKFKVNNFTLEHLSPKNALMAGDFEIWLTNESNSRLDSVSMYSSVEARSPFQDSKVIAAARNLVIENPGRSKQELLSASFPELDHIGVRKDKAGFVSPMGHWLRGNPKLIADSQSKLADSINIQYSQLKFMFNAPVSGDFLLLKKTWAMVALANWLGNHGY